MKIDFLPDHTVNIKLMSARDDLPVAEVLGILRVSSDILQQLRVHCEYSDSETIYEAIELIDSVVRKLFDKIQKEKKEHEVKKYE